MRSLARGWMMSDDDRSTRDDLEILEVTDAPAAPAPDAAPIRSRPPVRERAPTSLYQRPPKARRGTPAAPHPAPMSAPRGSPGLGAAYRQFVELCPFPLLQLDTAGRLLWANEAGCELLGLARRDLYGKPVMDTRLGVFYPELREDLARCASERNAPALRRTLELEDRDGRTVRRVCWIVPERNSFGQTVRLFGYVQPLVL